MITAIFVYLTQPLVVHRIDEQQRHTVNKYSISEIPGAETALELGLNWLQARLDANEEPVQTLIEPGGYNAEAERPVYNLVVTTECPQGSRTAIFTTDEMPSPVREAIQSVIATLEDGTFNEP